MKSKLTWMLTPLLALIMSFSFAQEKTITGNVTDQSGLPLPGVSVLVVGTTNGTQTDFDGNYTITASIGQQLRFSYIGQKTTDKLIGVSGTINVQLEEDAQALEEVVVVGYGTVTKEAFTGTAATISSENLEVKSFSNVSQALAGEVAGVTVINNSGQPGSTSTIRVRGFGSVNGNRDPLYVVDGVPLNDSSRSGTGASGSGLNDGNVLNSINPADIKSTTILKDATATAIYGARGANGVILITTKSGSANSSSIEVDVKTGVNVQMLPRNSVIKSPEEYIELSWEGLVGRGVATGEADPIAYADNRLFNGAISPSYNMWNVADGAELIDPATGKVRPGVSRRYNPEKWEDYGFQPSYRTDANVRLSGGTDKTRYFTSFGYLNDEGYIINSDYNRYSTRINLTHEVKPWLKGTMNMSYSVSETNNNGQTSDSGSIFWFVDNIPSIYPLFLRDADGNFVAEPIFGGNEYDYGIGRGFGALTNSIADAKYDQSRQNRQDLSANFSFDVKLHENLHFETRFGSQYFNNKYNSLNNPFFGSAAGQGGSIFKRDTEFFSKNWLQLLRFNKQFGDHSLEVLAAHESNDQTTKVGFASKSKAIVPDLVDLNNFVIVSSPPGSYTDEVVLESYFSQISYNYDGKYYLTGSFRRDGSSRFVKDKWGNFGSVGIGWIASKEGFLSNSSFINFLKFKGSYGLVGEQAGVGLYPGYNTFDPANLNDEISLSPRDNGNPDLTWETSKMFQAGVEFTLGDVLEGGVDYYIKNTDNLLFDRRVPPSQGIAIITVNDGQLRNSGLEFSLTGHLIDTPDFKLDLSLNGEVLDNEITQMPIEPSENAPKYIDDSNSPYAYSEGRSIFDFYLREWAGVDPSDGTPMWFKYYDDVNGNNLFDTGEGIGDDPNNGTESIVEFLAENPDANIKKETTKDYADATQVYVNKSAIPKVRGAFRLGGNYKNFSFGAQFLYSLGGYAYDFQYATLMNNRQVGNGNWHTDIRNRWQQPGDVTDVPRLSDNADTNTASSSSRFLVKSDFLSLNNLQVGYTIPSRFIEDSGISKVNISLSGDNLFLASTRKGYNPSTSESGSSNQYRYSPLSTFTLGVRVTF